MQCLHVVYIQFYSLCCRYIRNSVPSSEQEKRPGSVGEIANIYGSHCTSLLVLEHAFLLGGT